MLFAEDDVTGVDVDNVDFNIGVVAVVDALGDCFEFLGGGGDFYYWGCGDGYHGGHVDCYGCQAAVILSNGLHIWFSVILWLAVADSLGDDLLVSILRGGDRRWFLRSNGDGDNGWFLGRRG